MYTIETAPSPQELTAKQEHCQFCNYTKSAFRQFIPHTHLGLEDTK